MSLKISIFFTPFPPCHTQESFALNPLPTCHTQNINKMSYFLIFLVNPHPPRRVTYFLNDPIESSYGTFNAVFDFLSLLSRAQKVLLQKFIEIFKRVLYQKHDNLSHNRKRVMLLPLKNFKYTATLFEICFRKSAQPVSSSMNSGRLFWLQKFLQEFSDLI